jgi:hypothetical protein
LNYGFYFAQRYNGKSERKQTAREQTVFTSKKKKKGGDKK